MYRRNHLSLIALVVTFAVGLMVAGCGAENASTAADEANVQAPTSTDELRSNAPDPDANTVTAPPTSALSPSTISSLVVTTSTVPSSTTSPATSSTTSSTPSSSDTSPSTALPSTSSSSTDEAEQAPQQPAEPPTEDEPTASVVGKPSSFWAVEAATSDLVEIDVSSGRELRRVGGWGAELSNDPTRPQGLVSVEVSTDGWVWADDCCSPAIGNIFGLDPDRITGIDELVAQTTQEGTSFWRHGVKPLVSPNGALVASINYTTDIQVFDRSGEIVASLPPKNPDVPFTSVAWLDNRRLLVSEYGANQSEVLTVWDLSDPTSPRQVGPERRSDGRLIDAVGLGQDQVLLVTWDSSSQSLYGTVHDLIGGELVAVILPSGLQSIDVDPSGRFLLLVDVNGRVWTGVLEDLGDVLSIRVEEPVGSIEVYSASW